MTPFLDTIYKYKMETITYRSVERYFSLWVGEFLRY